MSKKNSYERTETLSPQLCGALHGIAKSGGIHDYIRVPAYFCQGTHARLKYWGLIEPDPRAAKRSGRWKVTELGVQFLRRQAEVREVAVVADDQVIRYEGRRVRVQEDHLPELGQTEAQRQAELVAAILADG